MEEIQYPRYIGVRLPAELHDKLAADAQKQRRTISNLLRNMIEDHYLGGSDGEGNEQEERSG